MAPQRSTRNVKRKVEGKTPPEQEDIAVVAKKRRSEREKTLSSSPISETNAPEQTAPEVQREAARNVCLDAAKETTSSTSTLKKDKPKASHPVDDAIQLKGSSAACYTVVENGGLVYDVVLNQCNISSNNNKYYRIQVVQGKNSGNYFCWKRWGRVGEPPRGSASNLLGPTSIEGAVKDFMSKFRAKTGNTFGTGSFVTKSGKYTLIEIDNDVEVKEEFQAEPREESEYEYKPSKLNEETQELIQAIFSKEMRDRALVNFKLDPQKLPLGVPSQEQIDRGIAILETIKSKLEGGEIAETFETLSSRFYTAIPHSFGRSRPPTICTTSDVQSRFEMCDVLLDMYSTTETLRKVEKARAESKKKLLTPPVDAHYDTLKADLNIVDQGSDEFNLIRTYFDKTKASHSSSRIINIWSVNREGEASRYSAFENLDNLAWYKHCCRRPDYHWWASNHATQWRTCGSWHISGLTATKVSSVHMCLWIQIRLHVSL